MIWRTTQVGVLLALCGTVQVPAQDVPVAAQDVQSLLRSFAEDAKKAADENKPTKIDGEQAGRDLQQAIQEFEAFLNTSPDRHKIGVWKTILQLDELKAVASGQKPSSETVVGDVIEKMRGQGNAEKRMLFVAKLHADYDDAIHKGNPVARKKYDDELNAFDAKLQTQLDAYSTPQLLRLRDALLDYKSTSEAAANTDLGADYLKYLKGEVNEKGEFTHYGLIQRLEQLGKEPADTDAALGLAENLDWLERHRQQKDLVTKIRQLFSKSNFFGYASRRFAAAGMERDIDQLSGINDNILGTSLQGTARMVGHTTLALNADPSVASMSILLGGTAWSNNVGYNGPVTIHSTGTTSISGKKMIWMDDQGLHEYAAQASCGTHSNINSICARCRIVENIAWKRAGGQKAEGEAIASQHAASRVAGQMNREAGRLIAEKNADYQNKFRKPLLRTGEFPEELNFSTSRERIEVRMRQDSSAMVGAYDAPPGFSRDYDLIARAHESAVANYAQAVLAGYELSDFRIEEIYKGMKAEVPEELRVTREDGTIDTSSTKEPWSMVFADERPVVARFSDGGVWIAIRLQQIKNGEDRNVPGKYIPVITELLEISAQYKIQKTAQGATLKRDEDVRIRFPDRERPDQINFSDRKIVFVRRKFRSMFKEEFKGEGLTFKGEWAKAGRLQLNEIQADDAWIRLGWDMTGEGASPAVPITAGGD
jgi:hypothetical protein